MDRIISTAANMVWHTRLLFSAYILLVPVFTSTLLPPTEDGAISPIIPLMLASEVLALIICAMASLNGLRLLNTRFIGQTTAVMLTIGTIPFTLAGFNVHVNLMFSCACAAFLGIGKAVAFLLWAHVFSCLGLQKSVLYGCATCLCAGLCAFLALGLRPEWLAIVAFASPSVCLGAWRLSLLLPEVNTTASSKLRHVATYPWRPIAIMALAGFSAGAGTATPMAHSMTQQTIPLILIGAATLAYVLLAKSISFDYVLKGSIAGYSIGFLGQAAFPHSGIPGYLIYASYWGLCLFAFCILCKASHDGPTPSEWLFGVGFAISEGIQLLGYLAPSLSFVKTPGDVRIAIVVAASLILALGMVLLWLSEHSKVGQWASSGISRSALDRPESSQKSTEALCRNAARTFGLSRREEEICLLLLGNKTIAEVAQELFVSQNTVKTHCKHIYAKCGVHSKQELRIKILQN